MASDQNSKGSPAPFSGSPPTSTLPSSPNLKEKPPDLDDGFQPVRNRRRFPPASFHRSTIIHPACPQQQWSRTNQNASKQQMTRNFQPEINPRIPRKPTSNADFQGKSCSTWADLVKNGGFKSNFDLEFVAPIKLGDKRVVALKEEVSLRTEDKWGNSVVAYVFGPRPHYHHFRDFVIRTWNPSDKFEIYARNNGFFIIRFSNATDCNKVINGGPFFITGKLIILKKWNKKLILDKDVLSTYPVWIRLPELNLRLWDKEAFSAIASVVGIPLKLDEPTANETRLGYARILVEIKADVELPEEAYITMHDGENIIQKIEYEWIPPRCSKCACFGHLMESCSSNLVWKEKIQSNLSSENLQAVEKTSKETLHSIDQRTDSEIIEKDVENQSTDSRNLEKTVQTNGLHSAGKNSITEKIHYFEGMEKDFDLHTKSDKMEICDDEQDENNLSHAFLTSQEKYCNVANEIEQQNQKDITAEGKTIIGNIESNSKTLQSNSEVKSAQLMDQPPLQVKPGLITDESISNESTRIDSIVMGNIGLEKTPISSNRLIENAALLLSSSSSPVNNKRKKNRKKSIQEIMGSNHEDNSVSKSFEEKYITKNPEWDIFLKVRDKKNYKKRGGKTSENLEASSLAFDL